MAVDFQRDLDVQAVARTRRVTRMTQAFEGVADGPFALLRGTTECSPSGVSDNDVHSPRDQGVNHVPVLLTLDAQERLGQEKQNEVDHRSSPANVFFSASGSASRIAR